MYIHIYRVNPSSRYRDYISGPPEPLPSFWSTDRPQPLHDIVITNTVWCMAYKFQSGRGVIYCTKSRNSIALVWVMQMGGCNKGMIDSCTHKIK